MALRDMTLSVLISAKDGLTAPLRNIDGKLGELEARLRSGAAAQADFNAKWQQTINLASTVATGMAMAGAAIAAGAGKAVQAALEQEAAEDKLRKIVPERAAALIELAAAMQKVTRFGDDEIMAAQGIGATYSALRPVLEQATKTALNMAEAYGMDVVSAMHLLGKAAAGNYGMLGRYGIMIDKVAVQSKGMAEVFRAIDEETQNVAFTSESGAKSLAQVTNALGEIAESVGGALLPALKTVTPLVQSLAEHAEAFANTGVGRAITVVAAGLGAVMLALAPLIYLLPTIVAHWGAVAGAATAAWAAMTGPVGLAIAGVAAVGAGIYALVDASNRQKQAHEAAFARLTSGAVDSTAALEQLRAELRGLHDDEAAGGKGLPRTPEGVAAAYEAESEEQQIKRNERILQLQRERNLAVAVYGEKSKQALEAENRLIEEQQRKIALMIDQLKQSPWYTEKKVWRQSEETTAVQEAIERLQGSFRSLEDSRRTVMQWLEALAAEEGDLSAVTRELTDDEKALTDAQKAAADAATEQGRAERDAARDVQDAAARVTDAEESIAEAYQDKARRVQDANRAVADAERDLADAIVAGEDRIKQAKQSAADAEQSAAERITSIRERLAELDAPELTPAQRKEKQRADLLKELAKAQEELAATRAKGVEDIRKAEDAAARMVEDAERRKADAVRARADVEAAADKRILEAYKAREKAVEALARTEERANERIAASVDKVTKANEKLAEAQAKVGGGRASGVGAVPGGSAPVATPVPVQPVYYPVAAPQPRVMPQAAFAGAGAGGGQIDIYLHTPPDFVVNTAMGAADRIVGSANGRPAVVRIVRDMFARR